MKNEEGARPIKIWTEEVENLPESDATIREREYQAGRLAKMMGEPRVVCPWIGGACETWWLEGYDSFPSNSNYGL